MCVNNLDFLYEMKISLNIPREMCLDDPKMPQIITGNIEQYIPIITGTSANKTLAIPRIIYGKLLILLTKK